MLDIVLAPLDPIISPIITCKRICNNDYVNWRNC